MRILVLGAGGVGGYFGARLQEAGGDLSFLVRPERARQMKEGGLRLCSPCGDLHLVPKVLTRDEVLAPFDVIILSCKAYDLESAMEAIAPAVGDESIVLPLLNGVRHMDDLAARFGRSRVLGGVALISAMLAPGGEIRHLNTMHRLVLGTLTSPPSKWLEPLVRLMSSAGFDFLHSDHVEQVLWDKIVFLATLAGTTCLMRASIGDALKTGSGESLITGLFSECAQIALVAGHGLSEAQRAAYLGQLTDRSSGLMASMLRDIERGRPTESEHILGDLIGRARALRVDAPLLGLAYAHLQAYELRRKAGES